MFKKIGFLFVLCFVLFCCSSFAMFVEGKYDKYLIRKDENGTIYYVNVPQDICYLGDRMIWEYDSGSCSYYFIGFANNSILIGKKELVSKLGGDLENEWERSTLQTPISPNKPTNVTLRSRGGRPLKYIITKIDDQSIKIEFADKNKYKLVKEQ